MKLKEILLVLLLVAVVSEAVRNKRNRRNKKEAQQQQQQQQRVARQQQQPRQQRQQQQPQGQRGSRQQRRPNRPAPRRRPRQQQRPQRPRTGAQRAQDFNLPDLKKLTNTKFNCDENKRWSMNYSSNKIMLMYLFIFENVFHIQWKFRLKFYTFVYVWQYFTSLICVKHKKEKYFLSDSLLRRKCSVDWETIAWRGKP